MLERVAKALGVNPEAIKNLDEDATLYNIFTNNTSENGLQNFNCTFNPLNKYIEAIEKIEKLHQALLKEKDEKIAMLKRLLDDKK